MITWSCIIYYGPGDACRLPDKISAVTYFEVLRGYVFASRDHNFMNPAKFKFQQDNAGIHTAKITRDFIKKSKIPVIEWPANSPDLNPIETVWAHLKKQLDRYLNAPRNMDELWERVQDIWTEITPEYLRKLYESMPRRMKELYHAKGDHIKY